MSEGMSEAQKTLAALWAEHVKDEFATKDVEATLATMVADAYVNHIPVMTGGVGQDALPVSQTIGTDRLVDEMIASGDGLTEDTLPEDQALLV